MGVFANDTFTASNGTALNGRTADSGGTWGVVSWGVATGAIQNNRAYGGNTFSAFELQPSPGSGNYSVFCDIVYLGFGGINPVGVFGRSDASGNGFALYRGNTTIDLYRYDAGVTTLLDSVSRSYEDCRVELRMLGSTIEGYVVNDATGDYVTSAGGTSATRQACVSATDAAHSTNTRVGMYLNNAGFTTRLHVDNFTAEEASIFTESVSSTISLTQSATVKIFRAPLYLKASGDRVRPAKLPSDECVNNVEPSEFLVEALSDTDSATYYYYGGVDSNNDWKINRYLKTDLNSKSTATESNNGAYSTLSAAWAARASLSYA